MVLRPDGSRDALVATRAVGMAHLPLDRSERSIAVSLNAPKLARQPGVRMVVDAKALAGQRAYVLLTAVDAGITNITRYEVPDPAGFFFGRRRYALDLYDVYGRIVEAPPANAPSCAMAATASRRNCRTCRATNLKSS